MTEIEQKAEEYVQNNLCNKFNEKINCKYDCSYSMSLYEENKELRKRLDFFNLAGHSVDKQTYNEAINELTVLKAQIEKMKHDLKTAFNKGMRHFANKAKEYDRINGAYTDYFEHTINEVLKIELENEKKKND